MRPAGYQTAAGQTALPITAILDSTPNPVSSVPVVSTREKQLGDGVNKTHSQVSIHKTFPNW